MSERVRTARTTGQSPTSQSVEALEEIVRNCQRNEERLHELERHTRHERKKAERLLRETYRTMEDRDSRNISITNDNDHIDDQKSKQRSSREFFISLDDENENHYRRESNNKNKNLSQDKHLLQRVEKLLSGDGTTTSSEIMSSQERQKKALEKQTSPVEDELDEKSLNIDNKNLPESSRQLPSACSIEHDLSAVDRLLSERTPINNHRIKSDIHLNQENQTKTNIDYNNEENLIPDKRDQQFYERLDNYVKTGRFVSPESEKQTTTTTTDDETYQYKSRPTPRINNKDDELADLARRCEDLLARLHTQRNRAVILENSTHHYDSYRRQTSPSSSSYEPKYHRSVSPSLPPEPTPMSLQQSLELLRPEFISRSRQRVRRIHLLREEREHNAEIDRERQQMLLFSCTNCCSNPTKRTLSAPSSSRRNFSYIVPYDQSNSSRISSTYHQIKRATKKKYEQLPEVNNRRRQNQMNEIRRRNLLRAKVFRTRLRQHVARHGRTDIDESLTIIDT